MILSVKPLTARILFLKMVKPTIQTPVGGFLEDLGVPAMMPESTEATEGGGPSIESS